MATIKGQNLRILLDGKCVAASTACTMHLSANVEDSSTKDDTGDWAQNEVVGLTWDVSVDALVTIGTSKRGVKTLSTSVTLDSETYYTDGVNIQVGKGQTISVSTDAAGDLVIYQSSTIKESGVGYIEWTNSGNSSVNVRVAHETSGTEVIYHVYGADAVNTPDLEVGDRVTVRFSTTKGEQNRVEDYWTLEGDAIISDISISAGNRQNSTLTVQLTGDGELTQSPYNVLKSTSPSLPTEDKTVTGTYEGIISNKTTGYYVGRVKFDGTWYPLVITYVGSTMTAEATVGSSTVSVSVDNTSNDLTFTVPNDLDETFEDAEIWNKGVEVYPL